MGDYVRELREALEERAREAHVVHALLSRGVLHPGAFEACPSMACKEVRRLLAFDPGGAE